MKFYEKHKKKIGAFFVIILVSIFSVFLANKTLPSSEGWYSYYAKCINDGNIVYKDFEYLFTPLYMYLIAIITKVFGYNIIVLRYVGVVIFAIIALLIYEILNKIFSVEISVIASVTGMYYLQSEVYTVFYDYVRVMDVFSYTAMLFMVYTIIEIKENKKTKKIYLWGLFSSLFFLVKQNMGGLFLVYSVLLIAYMAIIKFYSFKEWMMLEVKYFISVIIPIVVYILIFVKLNILEDMINSIFFSAVDAKGGLINILFRWIENGWISFARVLGLGVVYLMIALVVNIKLSNWYNEKQHNFILMLLFFIITSIGLIIIENNRYFGMLRIFQPRLDVTIIFIIDVVLMLYFIIRLLFKAIRKNEIAIKEIVYLSIIGGYFTLCYGAGMSGGLSIGESAFGLAIVISILFDSIEFKYGFIFKTFIVIYCVNLIWNCTSYKLIYPCEWWGIDESEVYSSTEKTNIERLKGIKLSKETANVYESIVDIVDSNCGENDKIYCFPDCPILYILSGKDDPGVYSKVQWFDVSTNESVEHDIKILENNLPKVIVIHNLFDTTYEGHEEAFNYGKISGTQKMRDALYSIVNKERYCYSGTFISGKDNFSVYVYNESQIELTSIFKKGKGSKSEPYQVENIYELVNLGMLANQGYDFEGVFFEQIDDIDCSEVVWIPFGYYGKFNGNYNMNDYEVENINNSYFNNNNKYGTNLFFQD